MALFPIIGKVSAVALLAVIAAAAPARAAETTDDVAAITVVADDNYPPYIFRDTSGNLCGVLPDEWRLWEKKTGVSVTLLGMDWSKAQQFLREGRADVIDTIFLNSERARLYDFTKPYARIEVPLFFHQDLGPIGEIGDLTNAVVGVKAGDACIGVLQSKGFHRFKEYNSYEAIIHAVADGELQVFSIDKPPALFYLNQQGLAARFQQSFTLYTGEFHRAVQKGRSKLLKLVEEGFAEITEEEHDAIARQWIGTSAIRERRLRYLWLTFLIAGAVGLTLLAFNLVLQAKVRQRTAALNRDIARRRQVEETLRQYQLMIEESSDEVYIVRPDGAVQYANAAAAHGLGYSLEEVQRLRVADFDPDYGPRFHEYFLKLKAGDRQPVETVHVTKDGRRIPKEMKCILLRWGGEEVVCGFGRDISARKRAEEERLNLERQMLQAQKMESLGVLAGGIAHDFNNLLTAILGNLNLALDELSPTAPAREEIHAAERATRQAADLARQMLAYSGKGRFEVRPVDLRRIIEEMTHMLQVAISKTAILRFNFAANLPAIQADVTQVRQIIMNLVINASEAIGQRSGAIAVSTGVTERDPANRRIIWMDDGPAGGIYVVLEVADTGCGIEPDKLGLIFDPFYTTKFAGHGLGLAAVLGIVRAHRGGIEVDSAPGCGTTFRILFPALDLPAAEAEHPAPASGAWRGQGRLLLVDDEESVRVTGKKMLERLGFEVLTAADGREGVAAFRARAADLAGVILDLTMPHLNGEAAFVEIRKIRADIPVILASGYTEQDIAERFTGLGLSGFIQKPFTLEHLRHVLQRVFQPSAPPPPASAATH